MPERRECITCGTALTGRIDRKFCSDQCRATYNNRQKQKHEKTILDANRILRKNRRILKTVCPEGKPTVRKQILDDMGFDFRYMTNLYKSGRGAVYFLCYDYGYTSIKEKGKEKVVIVQRQAYMDRYVPAFRQADLK